MGTLRCFLPGSGLALSTPPPTVYTGWSATRQPPACAPAAPPATLHPRPAVLLAKPGATIHHHHAKHLRPPPTCARTAPSSASSTPSGPSSPNRFATNFRCFVGPRLPSPSFFSSAARSLAAAASSCWWVGGLGVGVEKHQGTSLLPGRQGTPGDCCFLKSPAATNASTLPPPVTSWVDVSGVTPPSQLQTCSAGCPCFFFSCFFFFFFMPSSSLPPGSASGAATSVAASAAASCSAFRFFFLLALGGTC